MSYPHACAHITSRPANSVYVNIYAYNNSTIPPLTNLPPPPSIPAGTTQEKEQRYVLALTGLKLNALEDSSNFLRKKSNIFQIFNPDKKITWKVRAWG